MVDIGVACHQNDVTRIPAQRIHVGARHGQERSGTETVRPEFAMTEKRLRDLLI
jgi:hypothetical protein